ncbi:uncharacterized protein LOC114325569 [Diabrotica virgifera virgifera]|uniref:Uncharacterized protein LOC114325569 n=1 Tax=Diabrotica virgifera virgifera TaxID=50390 RepID=A0A6P7F7P1_DIAVI|nr:uncharacterized protein LOC114325569 [Diabrotica virgifera virgifera]
MKLIFHTLTAFLIVKWIQCYPVESSNDRKGKSLGYLDYMQPDVDYNNLELENDNYMSLALGENPLSRTIPSRKHQYNSPIYYIRIPPQPYMFVSGLGYVSQPVAPQMSQFLNVPVSFVSNGKPNAIYQWSGNFGGFPTPAPTQFPIPAYTPKPQKTTKKPLADSPIHKLPGSFAFNGKPEDIYVLRDSYNSLYNDVLQNVYP